MYSKKKNSYDLCIEHHGIKGQKWGVRRFQNSDGTLTSAGQKRYKKVLDKSYGYMNRDQEKKDLYENTLSKEQKQKLNEAADKAYTAHRKAQDAIIKNKGYEDDDLTNKADKAWLEYSKLGEDYAKQALGKYANEKDRIHNVEAYRRLGSIYYDQITKNKKHDWYDHMYDNWD